MRYSPENNRCSLDFYLKIFCFVLDGSSGKGTSSLVPSGKGFERAGFSRQQAKRIPAAQSRRSETSQSARVELVPFPGRRPPLQSPENNCSALDFYLTSFLLRRFVASRGLFVFRAPGIVKGSGSMRASSSHLRAQIGNIFRWSAIAQPYGFHFLCGGNLKERDAERMTASTLFVMYETFAT